MPDDKTTALERIEPRSMLEVISQAVLDPRCDVEKMRALFELQKDIQAAAHRVTFASCMARLQSKIPPMDKHGKAKNSRFARYDDIMAVMRPLLDEFGFSVSFDEAEHTEKTVTFAMTVSHEDGHAVTKRLTVQIDQAAKNSQGVGIRPAIQDNGSTVSYARRYLLKMHFNIVEAGEDTDGEKRTPITAEQVTELEKAIAELAMNRPKFLLYMGVGALPEILASDWKKAQNAIEAQRSGLAEAAKKKVPKI